jgi:hypothetical protein
MQHALARQVVDVAAVARQQPLIFLATRRAPDHLESQSTTRGEPCLG